MGVGDAIIEQGMPKETIVSLAKHNARMQDHGRTFFLLQLGGQMGDLTTGKCCTGRHGLEQPLWELLHECVFDYCQYISIGMSSGRIAHGTRVDDVFPIRGSRVLFILHPDPFHIGVEIGGFLTGISI